MAPNKEPTLVQLAEELLFYAHKLENSLPSSPTFQNDTIASIPPSLQPVRAAAIATSDRFNDLVRGCRSSQSRRWKYIGPYGGVNAMVWQFIYTFKVAHAVPLDGDISYEDLAEKTGANLDNLTQVLRYAFTIHAFCSPRAGYVAHTVDTRDLVINPTSNDLIGLQVEQNHFACTHFVDAIKKWPGSQEPNHAAMNVWTGSDKTMYEWLREDPVKQRRFGGAMVELSCGDAEAAGMTALTYPWTELGGQGVVADVGGGNGHISALVASKYEGLKFIVQDLPGQEKAFESTVSATLRKDDRVEFQIHDYFKPQTTVANAYFFSMVLHNLSDKYVVVVLRNLIPSLKPGARILWCDRDVPDTQDGEDERANPILVVGMLMKVLCNAKQRSLKEKVALLEIVDERLKFRREFRMETGSDFTIVEAIWDEA